MHRRNSCDRVMSSSAQIESTALNVDVGKRNATNRSGRSSLINFKPYPHPVSSPLNQKWCPNLDRVGVLHIVPIIAGSARDHPYRDTAMRQYCIPLHPARMHLAVSIRRGSDGSELSRDRLGRAIFPSSWYSGAVFLFILSNSAFLASSFGCIFPSISEPLKVQVDPIQQLYCCHIYLYK
jgi:hypothetical protein